MLKYCVLLLALAAAASCDEARKSKQHDDPFSIMDRLVHYMFPPRVKLWPWYDLFSAASLEDPKLVTNKDKCEIDLYVNRFEPEDLRVKVKNRFVIVEGRRKEMDEESHHFKVNRFVQNLALPIGCKDDEVVAVFENGVLSISAPRHEIPPPPPERNVPIEVRRQVTVETTPAPETTTTEKKEVEIQTSSVTPLEQLDLVEATTHVGKIRKKELKTTTKTSKDNEVSKGEGNDLDYSVNSDIE